MLKSNHNYSFFVFILCILLIGGNVCAQGFHHHPPPHHPQPTPPRPPAPPPTRFVPPPRPETMRPPSADQKMLHDWKNEVVDRVRGVANDHFDFNDESDWIEIDDPWEGYDWGEHDTDDASFVNHTFEVTQYRFKSREIIETYVNPYLPNYPTVYFKDDWVPYADRTNKFTIEGPNYTLEGLPGVVKKLFSESEDFEIRNILDSDDPNLRFIVTYAAEGINVIAATQISPGIYESVGLVKTWDEPYYTFMNGDTLVEVSPQWKDINIISMATANYADIVIADSINININDYNAPEPVAPIQQAEIATTPSDTPTTPEFKPVDVPQETPSTTVMGQDQQPEIVSDIPTTPEIKVADAPIETSIPTVVDIINKEADLSLQQWKDTLAKHDQPPQEELRAWKDPTPRYELKAWDGPKTPREELRALPEDWTRPMTVEETLKAGFETTALTVINVKFALVGLVISGAQGGYEGWENARKGGGDNYQKTWNAVVGAGTNMLTGAVVEKIGGSALGKLKINNTKVQKTLNVGNNLSSNEIAGKATKIATDFKPALTPMVIKGFVEGVPYEPSEYVQNLDPGTYGAKGGLILEREYYDY